MITITYKGRLENIQTATTAANKLLSGTQLYDDVRDHNKFDLANVPTETIADLMQNANFTMTVVMYVSLDRKVYGYDDYANPNLIHINRLRFEWTLGSLVNTMIHEAVHAVNNFNPSYEFGHRDNSSVGKENTAPYWIGNRREQIVEGTTEQPMAMIHDKHPKDVELIA